MINFTLPGIYTRFNINSNLNELKDFYPEFFRSNCRFETVYGAFPNTVWNGELNLVASLVGSDISNIVGYYNSQRLKVKMSCSNPLVDEKKLGERLCNLILEELEKGKDNAVEVLQESILSRYINETWPGVRQEVFCDELTMIPELLKQYDRVILRSALNRDRSAFDQISEEYRNRVEIMLNPCCVPDCGLDDFCESQIHQRQMRFMRDITIACPYWNRGFNDLFDDDFIIDNDELDSLEKKGFEHFRIIDNGNPRNLIDAYSYYFSRDLENRLRLAQIFEGWCGIR